MMGAQAIGVELSAVVVTKAVDSELRSILAEALKWDKRLSKRDVVGAMIGLGIQEYKRVRRLEERKARMVLLPDEVREEKSDLAK